MSREIKFRGRDVISGNWAYGYYYPSNRHAIIRNENDSECIVIKDTIGQFTGLNDKNGKEIYEGDVIKYGYHRDFSGHDYVEYTETVEWERDNQCYMSGFCLKLHHNPEVIGNIHQNPELLK